MAISARTPARIKSDRLWVLGGADHGNQGFAHVGHLRPERVRTPPNTTDLVAGMILPLTMMASKTHELSQLAGPHGALRPGDVLLADRAFCSFAHLVMLAAMSLDAVFRMHQRQIVDLTPGRARRGKSRKK